MKTITTIESIKYDENLIEYNTCGAISMISKTLFDAKFENLKDIFIIKNEAKVYEFIKNNETIFDLLEEVKTSLSKHFSGEKYFLQVRCYPEIYEKELALGIITDPNEDPDETTEKFLKVNLEINKSKIELGLVGKFFITLE